MFPTQKQEKALFSRLSIKLSYSYFFETEFLRKFTFIGLPGYQETAPFEASTLVSFRKRISADMLMEVNECLLESANRKRQS